MSVIIRDTKDFYIRVVSLCLFSVLLFLISCDSVQNFFSTEIQHPPEIEQALFKARQKPKGVIIIFGADWCPPCWKLENMLDQADVKMKLQPLYEIVKVDIGNWDKNIDVAKKYGNPIWQGIPGIVLLNQDGSIREIIEFEKISSVINGDPEVLMLYLLEN